jgi:zinc-ribbon domain
MFCASCGQHVKDGVRFCGSCGASLQAPGAIAPQSPQQQLMPKGNQRERQGQGQGMVQRQGKPKDPFQPQIKQLKLQIRQLRLDLQQVNSQMGKTRAQYNQSPLSAFPGMLREGSRLFEDARLWGPQKQKQALQQQIMQLQQQLLSLQQQQVQWQQQQP